MQRIMKAPSVENFLRFQYEPDNDGVGGLDPCQSQGAQGLLSRQMSVTVLQDSDAASNLDTCFLPRGGDILLMPRKQHGSSSNLFKNSRAQLAQGGSRQPSKGACPSVENLLRYSNEDTAAMVRRVSSGNLNFQRAAETDDQELQCLKHLELCSWFKRSNGVICSDICEIFKGNIEELVLSYWFDGAETADILNAEETAECQELVDEVARWAGLPKNLDPNVWNSKNRHLQCFRLRSDPFPAVHRPLAAYAMTAWLFPTLGNRTLNGMGFRVYRSGSTEYWFRPAQPDLEWMRSATPPRPSARPNRLPLVFCHGVGIGPTMCIALIEKMLQFMGDSCPIFLVDTAAVSMRFADNVPCAREMTANMVDMLDVWGFREAHFVGHSFGTFLCSWMVRHQRSRVARVTFMDPVCFLLLKVLVGAADKTQVRFDANLDLMELIIKYFVLTELFVCNFVCRCFFWEESHLDLDTLVGIDTMVVLESEDAIVPSHSVHRLILAERARRRQQKAKLPPAATQVAGGVPLPTSPPSSLTSSTSPAAATTAASDAQSILQVLWVEGMPHAGLTLDADVTDEVCRQLHDFHRATRLGGQEGQP